MKKRILIAGGTGLVGRNLTTKIAEAGLPFISTSHKGSAIVTGFTPFDLCEFQDCLSATVDIDTVVLCAAVSYGAKKNKEMPTASIIPNLKIFSGLLEACARNNVKTVIMLSSSTIYQVCDHPIKEDELDLNQPPHSSYFGVGWTYRYIEKLAALYSKIYGIKVIILRPTNIYGPFDKFDEENAHVIPSLIRRSLNKEVWGGAEVVRDFIFVDDLVKDILSIINKKIDTNDLPVNICNGKPITIKDAAEVILRACNHKTKLLFNTDKPSGIVYRAVDNSRYVEIFGNRQRTDFEIGIRKTVEWFKKLKI